MTNDGEIFDGCLVLYLSKHTKSTRSEYSYKLIYGSFICLIPNFFNIRTNESHFYPIDSLLFIGALKDGATVEQLKDKLLEEFELSDSEAVKLTEDAINSFKSDGLVEEVSFVTERCT